MIKIHKRPPVSTPEPQYSGGIIASYMLLSCFLPYAIVIAISELSPLGPRLWLEHIMALWLFVSALMIPPLVGFKAYRASWAIAWLWAGGVIMSLLYLPVLALTAALAFGWLEPGIPDGTPYFRYFAFGAMLFCQPLYYYIYRLMTMRYFQPWTTPDQWEKESYTSPAWAKWIVRNAVWLIALYVLLRSCQAMISH